MPLLRWDGCGPGRVAAMFYETRDCACSDDCGPQPFCKEKEAGVEIQTTLLRKVLIVCDAAKAYRRPAVHRTTAVPSALHRNLGGSCVIIRVASQSALKAIKRTPRLFEGDEPTTTGRPIRNGSQQEISENEPCGGPDRLAIRIPRWRVARARSR